MRLDYSVQAVPVSDEILAQRGQDLLFFRALLYSVPPGVNAKREKDRSDDDDALDDDSSPRDSLRHVIAERSLVRSNIYSTANSGIITNI